MHDVGPEPVERLAHSHPRERIDQLQAGLRERIRGAPRHEVGIAIHGGARRAGQGANRDPGRLQRGNQIPDIRLHPAGGRVPVRDLQHTHVSLPGVSAGGTPWCQLSPRPRRRAPGRDSACRRRAWRNRPSRRGHARRCAQGTEVGRVLRRAHPAPDSPELVHRRHGHPAPTHSVAEPAAEPQLGRGGVTVDANAPAVPEELQVIRHAGMKREIPVRLDAGVERQPNRCVSCAVASDQVRAFTLTASVPSIHRKRSKWWEARSRSTPPPDSRRVFHTGSAPAAASAKMDCTARTRPMRPPTISSRARRWAGWNRRLNPMTAVTPAAATASSTRRAPAESVATGFSRYTCFPLRAAATASSAWSWVGAAIRTASMSVRSSTAAGSATR